MIKKKDSLEKFNIQLFYIEDVAGRIQKIGTNLAKASNGMISGYREALGELYTLYSLLLGADLYFSFKHREYIELNLEIAEYLQSLNELREGVKYLNNSLRRILYIIRLNDLLFPKRSRGISFKKFVERETGIGIK